MKWSHRCCFLLPVIFAAGSAYAQSKPVDTIRVRIEGVAKDVEMLLKKLQQNSLAYNLAIEAADSGYNYRMECKVTEFVDPDAYPSPPRKYHRPLQTKLEIYVYEVNDAETPVVSYSHSSFSANWDRAANKVLKDLSRKRQRKVLLPPSS